MNNVSISAAALDQIQSFMESYEHCFGVKDVPKFSHDERISTLRGEVSDRIEVMFFDSAMSNVEGQKVGELSGGEPLLFFSRRSLIRGMHFIDLIDGEFRLTSLGG